MITKGGLNASTYQLAMEYARDGIRLCMGVATTPGATAFKDTPEEFMKKASPMARVSTVNEIADAVLFLTEAESVTGEVLHIDGGAHRGKW